MDSYLVSFLLEVDGAGELGGSASYNNSVVLNHVSDDAESIMDGSVGLVDHHTGRTSHQNGDGSGSLELLDDQHLVVVGTELDFSDLSGLSELLGGDFLESGDDSGSGGDGDELDIDSTKPSDGGEVVLEEEMVGLVVEAPLTHGDVGARVLDLLDHVSEVVLFLLDHLLVVLTGLDNDLVLVLEFGGLEGASQDANLSVGDFLLHLGV